MSAGVSNHMRLDLGKGSLRTQTTTNPHLKHYHHFSLDSARKFWAPNLIFGLGTFVIILPEDPALSAPGQRSQHQCLFKDCKEMMCSTAQLDQECSATAGGAVHGEQRNTNSRVSMGCLFHAGESRAANIALRNVFKIITVTLSCLWSECCGDPL